jgi:hypothetical protein
MPAQQAPNHGMNSPLRREFGPFYRVDLTGSRGIGRPPDGRPHDIYRSIGQFAPAPATGMSRASTAPDTATEIVASTTRGGDRMLWTIFVILLVLWAVGMVSSYTLGGFIHLLLLIAIAVVLIRIIQGRRPV